MPFPEKLDHATCDPAVCDQVAPKVHDLSAWTDPTTERMRHETGHDCIACPSDVRNLMAVAHNTLVRLDAARTGGGDWGKFWEKVSDLREALAVLQPRSEEHFAALNRWRRP